MSAIVCGKKSNYIFDDLLLDSPPVSKRIRCSPAPPPPAPPPASRHPRRLLPQRRRPLLATPGVFERQCCCLSGSSSPSQIPVSGDGSTATMGNNGGHVASENQSATDNLPKDGSEWVDLFVWEIMSATDVDDARVRASRVLEVLEKSIVRASAETNKETMMLKEQVQVLLRENSILKRAVTIRHEVQQEYTVRDQELQHLKQLVPQYQEQLKTLEMNNYALTMHLKQAQQSSSIPGHFHPDIF